MVGNRGHVECAENMQRLHGGYAECADSVKGSQRLHGGACRVHRGVQSVQWSMESAQRGAECAVEYGGCTEGHIGCKGMSDAVPW